jgi:hypothetical protein
MGGACSTNEEKMNAYTLLVAKTLLGRPRRWCVDNVRMDLVEMEWGVWTGLVWLRRGAGGELL